MEIELNKTIIKKIEKEAKKYFQTANGCHDWSHVERVRKNALKIAGAENADLDIVEISVFLHDIAKNKEINEKGKFCHAIEGAKKAERILRKHGIDKEIIEKVKHAIEAHRFRNSINPETIEAKVVQDADRLDAIGAVGVARDFLFAGGKGSQCLYTGREKELAKHGSRKHAYTKNDSAFLEYEVKLKFIKDKMQTETGKKIALDRHRFMENYFQRFWQEVTGEK